MSAVPAVSLPAAPPARPRRLWPMPVPPPPPVSVVVPCYNEQDGLPALLERLDILAGLGWEVVFVDDGSRDGTFGVLLSATRGRPWMRVVRHATNLGLGAAMRTGFQHARGAVVCTIDSDCSYPPERMPELVALIEQGADIATASPWHPESTRAEGGRLRLALSRGVSCLYRAIVGREVHTFTCLFRAYRRDVLEATPFRGSGFGAVTELLLRGMLAGRTVRELPMSLEARRYGRSKLRVAHAVATHGGILTLTALLVGSRWMRGMLGAREVA